MEDLIRPLKITGKLMEWMNEYWESVGESHQAGRLVAWSSGGGPSELLKAMDITVTFPELYAPMCSAAGVSTTLCQSAEAVGYSRDLCSVIRNQIGSTHGKVAPEMLPWGGLPKPDLLLCMAYCPGITKTWEMYSRFFDVPLFVMERPRLHDTFGREETSQITKDLTQELWDLASFLEGFTRRRFDYDRLSEILALEREAAILWWDVLALCQNIPSPMSAFDAFTQLWPFYAHRGEPKAVAYNRELKAELAERVAQGIGSLAGEEKYRLYWDNLPIYYKLEEHMKKFAAYGAVPVVAQLPFLLLSGYPDLNPENPLESIAELLFFHPSNQGLKGRIESISKLVAGYSVDGLVMQRSRTCLVVNMGQDDIAKALTERIGVPAVILEGDICDSRFYSDSEFNQKIDAFMELLVHQG